MDPVTAAGVGLGATSLVLQVFAGCVKGYQLLIEMAGMPAAFQHLVVRLRLEEARLLNWGEKVDLADDMLDQPSRVLCLHRSLILDVLMEMQVAFRSCLKTGHKYGSLFPAVIPTSNTGSDKRSVLVRTVAMLDKAPSLSRRLEWALIDQNKLSSLVNRLIGYNDLIESLLDRTSLDELKSQQNLSHMAILQLTSKVDELKILVNAFSLQAPSQEVLGMSRSSTLVADNAADSSTSARLAAFKAEQTGLEIKSGSVDSVLIDYDDIKIDNPDSMRPTGNYRSTAIWIEWKEYDNQRGPNSDWERMISERMKNLSILLSSKATPAEFRAPSCIGYFNKGTSGSDRYGLVYQISPDTPEGATPLSLREHICTNNPVTLTERISLAHSLAQSLMYLHSVSWLHKNIRSENILFFPQSTSISHTVPITHPILSGFGYARPDNPSAETERQTRPLSHDMYRPPECHGISPSRSTKTQDIFALGILLVEIGYWQPIEEVMGIALDNRKRARKEVSGIRARFLDEQGEFHHRLRQMMGEIYAGVARVCIAGGPDMGVMHGQAGNEENPVVSMEIHRVFTEEVVGRLASIKT